MGQAERELPDGLHLLRLQEIALGLEQLLLRFVALGDVAGDFGKPHQFPVFPDGIDHDAGTKAGPVLPQSPALGDVAPF